MITPDEALQIILRHVTPLPVEMIEHGAALGRTLARDIESDLELPPFDNSAMDGYAVVAGDTRGATPEAPMRLRVLETVASGAVPRQRITTGCAIRIMTGAVLPDGADAVVMREDTRTTEDGEVLIGAPARPQENVRRAGSDVTPGETVLWAGTVVRAAEWGMLASLNRARVEVRRQPRVGVVATGEELVEVGQALAGGRIHDSNSFTLDGLVRATGAATTRRRVGDDLATLEGVLRELAEGCDAIVTSGGVSAGDFDPVRDVLQATATVHFWKIAMKPGKPVMFATLPAAGERAVPVFGLPGNPVSVMVAFEQFVRPALLRMQGRRALRRIAVPATLSTDHRSTAGKTEFVRALVTPHDAGWQATLAGDQGSGRLSSMTRSNALLVVPPALTFVAAGQSLPAQMTDWPEME